jgi:hypothetical protein
MRKVLLVVTLLFIAALAVLTVLAFVDQGPTFTDVFAIAILVLFSVGIVGALRTPPRQ